MVVSKGAPEVIKLLLSEVPPGYDSLYKSYASMGARVISLATKKLRDGHDRAALKALPREDVEAELEWVGFAIFQCPLKEESEPALKQLADSSHQLVMITGDAPLTACFAASKVHIITRSVVLLSHSEEETGQAQSQANKVPRAAREDSEYQWVSPDESIPPIPFNRSLEGVLSVASQYDLAISGDALSFLESIKLTQLVIPLCQVFARVSPEQKELVIVTLRAAGRVTLMCGDGTNDVGGLKAAHVGVALLSPTGKCL